MFVKRSMVFLLVAIAALLAQSLWTADALWAADEGVDGLIRQLDHDEFSKRQTASLQLSDMGKTAIPALAEAAKSGSRERSQRGLEILKKHLNHGDDATKSAAKAALEQLARGDHPAAARRAKDILEPPKPSSVPTGAFNRVPIQVMQQRARIIRAAGAGRRINMKVVNGVRDIEVQENGRSVKIHEDAAGIKIEVTEKKMGKPETKKYEAKNADELKKKHPEGYKLYQQYAQGRAGIRLGGFQALPAPPQIPPPPIPANGAAALDRLKQQFEERIETYKKKLANGEGDAEVTKRMIERIERMKQQIEEMSKRMQNR